MKNKIGLRSILATLLIMASVCSYIYLNTVQLIELKSSPQVQKLYMEDQSEEQKVLLPDVEIIKKVIEKTRQAITF